MGQLALKMLISIFAPLIAKEALVDLFVWFAKFVASKTESTVDDELVMLIEKHIAKDSTTPKG